MKLQDFGWVADENISPRVALALKEVLDITTAKEAGLLQAKDEQILAYGLANNRIILTQDSDFGTLAFASSKPFLGIVYLRPGNYNPQECQTAIRHLLVNVVEVKPPFIVVL